MPLIQLRDGVSIDEYVTDPTSIGYLSEGECVINHPEYGTVGKLYDPKTKSFSGIVGELETVVGAMTMKEASTMAELRKRGPLDEKFISSAIDEGDDDEQAILDFKYLVDSEILTYERAQEIMLRSKYSHLADEASDLKAVSVEETIEELEID